MTNTGSARSATTSAKTRWLGLILLFAWSITAPTGAIARDEPTPAATRAAAADFDKVSLPTLMKMEPFIERSAAERSGAYKALRLDDKTCVGASDSASEADQQSGKRAAVICIELAAFLGGNDILACTYGSWDDLAQGEGAQNSTGKRLANSYKEHRVKEIHDRLQVAAACGQKDKTYWAHKTIEAFYRVSSGPKLGRGGLIEVSTAISQIPFRSCSYAGYKAGKTEISNVAGAAFEGCSALESYSYSVTRSFSYMCNALQRGLTNVVLDPGKDVFESERPRVKASLEAYYTALKCTQVIAEAMAQPKPPSARPSAPAPAPSRMQQAEALVRLINGENQNYGTNIAYAKSWYDRGETLEACKYYQKQLNNVSALITAYEQLGELETPAQFRDQISELKQAQRVIYENEDDDCRDVKYRLHY